MNGEPLPAAHGFPARLIVPGLYGYVSATKWLTEIELTTLEAFDAYWVPLGWAKEAPILTQSRIDVPRHGLAGHGRPRRGRGRRLGADARHLTRRGAGRRGSHGSQAELSVPLTDYAWVQWRVDLDVPVGEHTLLQVRATDGDGETQTDRADPARARWRARLPHDQGVRRVATLGARTRRRDLLAHVRERRFSAQPLTRTRPWASSPRGACRASG